MPTLYSHPNSTFARRVRIALLEKGVEWEIHDLDFLAKEHRSEAFLTINPYGRVPALVDGDLRLAESSAILGYLEAQHPEPPLMPSDPAGRAEVDMMVKLCDLQFTGHVGTVIFPKRFLPESRWRKEAITTAEKAIQKHLFMLDTHLFGREWLVRDTFSLADVAYGPFLDFLPLCDVTIPPNVGAYHARLTSRPSMLATRAPDHPTA